MLKGMNAFVTGGDRGIGRSIVLKFAGKGANVYFTYNSDIESARKTKKEALMFNTAVDFFKLDLTNVENIKEVIAALKEQVGAINILVNNAGIVLDSLFVKADMDDWWKVIDIIFGGTVRLTKELLSNIIRQDHGRIINISSTAGLAPVSGQTNYTSAKSAVIMFTRTLAKEIARLKVTVNAIAPGYIQTDMTDKYDVEMKKQYKKKIPMHRFGQPEEVANVALFLASNLSGYITGEVIKVDGGLV